MSYVFMHYFIDPPETFASARATLKLLYPGIEVQSENEDPDRLAILVPLEISEHLFAVGCPYVRSGARSVQCNSPD